MQCHEIINVLQTGSKLLNTNILLGFDHFHIKTSRLDFKANLNLFARIAEITINAPKSHILLDTNSLQLVHLSKLFFDCRNQDDLFVDICSKTENLNLQRLVMTGGFVINDDLIELLPKSMDGLILRQNNQITSHGITHLPNQLGFLMLPSVTLPLSILATLPVTLLYLHIGKIDFDTKVMKLPHELIYLEFSSTMQKFNVRNLPRTLLTLTIGGPASDLHDDQAGDLPPLLEKCYLLENKSMTMDCSASLPRNLRYLKLGANTNVWYDVNGDLPSKCLVEYFSRSGRDKLRSECCAGRDYWQKRSKFL